MKRFLLLAMACVMMLVSLGGCYWRGYEGHDGDRRHGGEYRGGERDRGDRGGSHEERR